MPTVVENEAGKEAETSTLDSLAREGARRMIAAALELEVAEYVRRMSEWRDERGHALVVRNGHAKERKVTVGAGTMPLRAPRVNDKRVIVSARRPPYCREGGCPVGC
jgi:hypothetical protein